MGDDLSLLFKLRGDNAQLKSTIAETRVAVAQLRQSFGPELAQTVSATNKAFSQISDNLNVFVGQRIPLVGGAFVRVTENLRGVGSESNKAEKAISSVAKSIQSISTESGKSIPQITSFLTKFVQIEGQAKRDAAAIEFLGVSLGAKLIPQLETTATELSTVASESVGAGGALAGMALPIGAVVIALVAASLALGAVTKELIEITKHAADFEGKMFDLSQATGLGVETLSTLEVGAKTTGGSLDSLAASLGIFQRKLEEAQDPLSKSADSLRDLGVTSSDTEVALRQTIAALFAMPEGAAQTAKALELFGRGGKQVLAILKETNGDLDGLTRRLREAGVLITTDAARSADKLNDELALLDFQIRAAGADLAKELIPALTDAARNLAEVVRAARPLLALFSQLAGPVAHTVADSLKGLGVVVKALTLDYAGLRQSIREVNEEAEKLKDIPALDVSGPSPVELPQQQSLQAAARQAAQTADVIVASAKRAATETNQALSEAFERGRTDRQRQAQDTIAVNAVVLDAEKKRIAAQLALKDEEARQLQGRDDLSAAEKFKQLQKLNEDAQKIRQQELDAESLFNITSRELRARAAKEGADARRNQEKNNTDILVNEFDRQIKSMEAAIQRGATVEAEGLTIIEALEQAKIDARRESLEKQKEIGFLTIQDQKDLNNEIQKLDQDADRLRDEQQARRLQKDREAAQRSREIKIQEIDTTLELQRIAGERTISAIESLAALRIKSEEQAAQEILRIKLDLIDQEITATQAKLAATKSIANKDDRVRAEVELNSQLRVLTEQRKTFQAEGNRAIDEGRQQDLENERQYADELKRIKERIRDIELDAAREVIDLMRIHFASRKDIVRKQRDLELDEEAERHRIVTDSIDEQKRELDAQIKLLEAHLKVSKIGTTEEIEQYERIIATLDALRLKRLELGGEQEAEDARSEARRRRIADQKARDEALAGPGGGFSFGLETGQLKEIEGGIQSFQDVAITAFSAVGAAVNGLAQGVGSLVQNFVLLGSNGPNAFRKLVASVLAGVAAQAAVMAIMELAYGIAALTPWGAAIYGPAPFHFKSAALFGAIALTTGLAGRGVASGLFQQGGAGGTGGGRSGGGSSTGSGARDPIDLTRTQQNQELHIFLHGEAGPGFHNAVFQGIVDNVRSNGPMRTVIKKVAEE